MNTPDPITPSGLSPYGQKPPASPFLTTAGLLARRAVGPTGPEAPRSPPPDTIDTQIRDSGARVALHREQAILTMQEALQHSIVSMSHDLKADIAGVKDRVDDLATSVERIEQKVKDNEQAK